jgi:la-related protein 1
MATLPTSLHWRVCLELADFLKRENAASQARKWYAKVVQLQPTASPGWLEYAKLEEECGRLTKCRVRSLVTMCVV